MKKITTSTLPQGALSLFTLSVAVVIAVYALLTALTIGKELQLNLTCEASWEIDHGDGCGDIVIPEAGIEIASEQALGHVIIEHFKDHVLVNEGRSVRKALGIHSDRNEQLAATISFQYQESELAGLPEEDLILYSSQDEGHTWQAHYNSIVDPINNSIHLSEVGHSSLWTAAYHS